jgi:hypothetical protein
MTEPSAIDFSLPANTTTPVADRFRIVFKTSSTLALNATTVQAYQQNGGIKVDWSVARENNISAYEVEKSADGQAFKKLGAFAPTSNNNTPVSYTLLDKDPLNGNNFYRVKAIEKSGDYKYSQVVKVLIGSGKAAIVVYQNPVIDKTLVLQLNNEPAGKYYVQLFNGLGQQLMSRTINHSGGSSTQSIPLQSVVSKGVYQLHVTNGKNRTTEQIVVE